MKDHDYTWIEVPVPTYFNEFLNEQFCGDTKGRDKLLSLIVAVGMSLFEHDVVQILEPGHVRLRKKNLPRGLRLQVLNPTKPRLQ